MNNEPGAPPPFESLPAHRVECPALFWVLEIGGILFVAAALIAFYIFL